MFFWELGVWLPSLLKTRYQALSWSVGFWMLELAKECKGQFGKDRDKNEAPAWFIWTSQLIAAASKALSLYGIITSLRVLKWSEILVCCACMLLSNAASLHCLVSSGSIESNWFVSHHFLYRHWKYNQYVRKQCEDLKLTEWIDAAWCRSVECSPVRYLSCLRQPRPCLINHKDKSAVKFDNGSQKKGLTRTNYISCAS